uniref:UBR-type domain-containing protein n=1 Tax=Ascaris lumbricoides TaxID=6252 RepID=A0A0M3I3G8_ASCLU
MWNGEGGAGCSSAVAKGEDGSRKRAHDESDAPISLQEVVAIDQYLEDEARALLGTANESVCTYPEGYTPRQMVYACKTCNSASEPAAICYGCSIHCHEEHDLVELYTKRTVCCDCGNSKFKNRCTLFPEKVPLNERNKYNHNYSGLYCICNRPYPAPECDDDDEEMVQCIICEDWFHINHLNWTPGVGESENDEVVCGKCASTVEFLKYYADKNYEEIQDVEVCKLKALMHRYTVKEENIHRVHGGFCEEGEGEVRNERKTAASNESRSLMLRKEGEAEEKEDKFTKSETMNSEDPEERLKACESVGEQKEDKRNMLETDRGPAGPTGEINEGRNDAVVRNQAESIDSASIKEVREGSELSSSFEKVKEGIEAECENDGPNVQDEGEYVRHNDDDNQGHSFNECKDEERVSEDDHETGNNECKESSEVCRQSVGKLDVLLFKSTMWRERLCRCQDCLSMYEEKEVGFLLDPEDTLASYTKDRYTDRPSEEVEKKRVIDGLVNVAGRDVALCVLQGYERMKSKVVEMLARKSAEDSTVTKEDIARTFSELREEMKRPRLE